MMSYDFVELGRMVAQHPGQAAYDELRTARASAAALQNLTMAVKDALTRTRAGNGSPWPGSD
ncbi:hypothetical protein DA2_3909 [Desulfovibrio sp. A2]|nr:hypothetical protein DA2_3909 [Desulfovibrio sp. A2]